MNAPQQQVLPIRQTLAPTLDDFVGSDELVAALAAPLHGFSGFWLSGQPASGRSHLLQGACASLQAQGERCAYIACAGQSAQRTLDALEGATESGALVAVDDVDALLAERGESAALVEEGQGLLLGIYQRLVLQGGRLIVSHATSAGDAVFATPDLASRMRSLQHFRLSDLTDEDKKRLLARRAERLGFALDDSVLNYWLTHGPRDTAALLRDLARLDTASLARHNAVTVPLLKQVLGY